VFLDVLDNFWGEGLACCGVLGEAVDEDSFVAGVDESLLELGRAVKLSYISFIFAIDIDDTMLTSASCERPL
jgi:hypothetical protein